jgi:Ca2+/Na+ antiporter
LLRDIIFFIVAAYAAYVAMYDGKIHFAESFGFIIMYIVYLLVLIGGHLINRRMKDRRAVQQAEQTQEAAKTYGSIQTPPHSPPQTSENVDEETPILREENQTIPDESYAQQDVSYAMYFRHAFLPREETPWRERGVIGKMFAVISVRSKFLVIKIKSLLLLSFQMPVNLILHYTIPLVDHERPEHNWHKLLNSFHLLSGPLTVSLLTQG